MALVFVTTQCSGLPSSDNGALEMSRRAEIEAAATKLMRCPRCGGPRKLVDLREEAKKVGLSYPADQPRFVIECCGVEVCIEDNQVYERVIAWLQKQSDKKRR
jgi:hypothetical protein